MKAAYPPRGSRTSLKQRGVSAALAASACATPALTLSTMNGDADQWSPEQARNLSYCVSADFGPEKHKELLAALKKASEGGWEKFADVKFVHLPNQDGACNADNPNVLFRVVPGKDASAYHATAFYPGYPAHLRNVTVFPAAFAPTLPWLMAHELGHVLGFRHEHIRPEAGSHACAEEDPQWRPVTNYDSASVMHLPQCNGTNRNQWFSRTDRVAAAKVYGPPRPPDASAAAPSNEGETDERPRTWLEVLIGARRR